MAGRVFDLNEKQKRLAEALALGDAEEMRPLSIKEACELVGVARCTYYAWKTNPEFTDYINYVSDQAQASNIHKYYQVLDQIICSSENDHARLKGIELVLKRMGKLRDNAVQIEMSDKDLVEKTADELRADMEKMRKEMLGEDGVQH